MPDLAQIAAELGDAATMVEAAIDAPEVGAASTPTRRELLDGALTLIDAVATRLSANIPAEQIELATKLAEAMDIPNIRPAENIQREINSTEMAVMVLAERGDGAELRLTLVRSDGSRVSVVLGPAEAVGIAADLLQVARVRFGRADWPPRDAA